jgi:hypothetical protein
MNWLHDLARIYILPTHYNNFYTSLFKIYLTRKIVPVPIAINFSQFNNISALAPSTNFLMAISSIIRNNILLFM